MKYQTCKEGARPHPRTSYYDAGINHPTSETVKHQQQELPTAEQMRATSEALKGVDHACDITRAKPEFVEFIRTCSPAAVISTLDRLEAQSEHLTRITAQRNRYWEQVEVLVETLRSVRAKFFEDASAGGYVERGKFISFGNEQHPWIPGAKAPETIAIIDAALAAVAEEGEQPDSERST